MISFGMADGSIEFAAFGGDMAEIASEIFVEISLVYGALYAKNEDTAEAFKRAMVYTMVDGNMQKAVFDPSFAKELKESGRYGSAEVNVPELVRQLEELGVDLKAHGMDCDESE